MVNFTCPHCGQPDYLEEVFVNATVYVSIDRFEKNSQGYITAKYHHDCIGYDADSATFSHYQCIRCKTVIAKTLEELEPLLKF
jgi:hypothetical protein